MTCSGLGPARAVSRLPRASRRSQLFAGTAGSWPIGARARAQAAEPFELARHPKRVKPRAATHSPEEAFFPPPLASEASELRRGTPKRGTREGGRASSFAAQHEVIDRQSPLRMLRYAPPHHLLVPSICKTPAFVDSGSMIAPRGGFFTRDGKWAVENEGVGPDIDVENWPKDVIGGRDPQLERAVAEAMRMLKERPVDRAVKEPPPPTWGKRPSQ